MRSKILVLAAAATIGTVTMMTDAMAFKGGPGGGGGRVSGVGGHWSGGIPAGRMVTPGIAAGRMVTPGIAAGYLGGPKANFAAGNWTVSHWGHHDHHHHFHRRFFVGLGLGLYGWPDYGYDSCYVQTPYGWRWVCGYY
jgi:hypothetical protein